MTSPQGLPVGMAYVPRHRDPARPDEPEEEAGPTVGASDADADAAASGANVEITPAERDSDGVPVGEADAEADRRDSGA
ncbi:hypothetical protein ODJ79_20950 [Actinoplanes sp. KI2]|uniref:hypothetical protein n=1 Tax=Actinoplanes sp. KI2 TaxID=2983315 RepID=UPI0021D5FF3F|nr:hypothetical protein [Actinoplanes sp. KI2]MCU7726203.1 hypothetical protein [Actinoplanes sp. KI2]